MENQNQDMMGMGGMPELNSELNLSPQNPPSKSKKKLIMAIGGSFLALALVAAGYFTFFSNSAEKPPSLDFSANQGFIALQGEYGFKFELTDFNRADSKGNSDNQTAGGIPYYYSEEEISLKDAIESIDPGNETENLAVSADSTENAAGETVLLAQIGLYDNALKKFPLYPAGIFSGLSAAKEMAKSELNGYKIPAYTPFFIFTNKNFGTWDLKDITQAPSSNNIDIESLNPGWYMMVFKDDADLQDTFYSCSNGIESIWTYRGPDAKPSEEFGRNSLDLSDVSKIKLTGNYKLAWVHKNITKAEACVPQNTPVDAASTADGDGDQVADNIDNCSAVANASQADSDNDSVGNACDTDYQSQTTAIIDEDDDGVADDIDNCPADANDDQADTDNDGDGNVCDTDDDDDGYLDGDDDCPLEAVNSSNDDGNGCVINPADLDTDGDGILDNVDNCIDIANDDQANNDNDTKGNVCDPDDDNDGVMDSVDACPLVDFVIDNNGDGCEDVDVDTDGDGISDLTDNCPTVSNANQADTSNTGVGDACIVCNPLKVESLNCFSELKTKTVAAANITITSLPLKSSLNSSTTLNSPVCYDTVELAKERFASIINDGGTAFAEPVDFCGVCKDINNITDVKCLVETKSTYNLVVDNSTKEDNLILNKIFAKYPGIKNIFLDKAFCYQNLNDAIAVFRAVSDNTSAKFHFVETSVCPEVKLQITLP